VARERDDVLQVGMRQPGHDGLAGGRILDGNFHELPLLLEVTGVAPLDVTQPEVLAGTIQDAPLAGRDLQQLVNLLPGATIVFRLHSDRAGCASIELSRLYA